MSEELRQVRDTLIEALRRSDLLTLEGRALFRRYAALSEAAAAANTAEVPGPVQAGPMAAAAQPAVPAAQPAPAARRRPTVDEEDEFGGSFMVRNNPPPPTTPGYRETPPQQPQRQADLPRSLRDRRR